LTALNGEQAASSQRWPQALGDDFGEVKYLEVVALGVVGSVAKHDGTPPVHTYKSIYAPPAGETAPVAGCLIF